MSTSSRIAGIVTETAMAYSCDLRTNHRDWIMPGRDCPVPPIIRETNLICSA